MMYVIFTHRQRYQTSSVLRAGVPFKKKILFRYGELIRLSPGGGGRCGRERGMGGQDGLRAGAGAR